MKNQDSQFQNWLLDSLSKISWYALLMKANFLCRTILQEYFPGQCGVCQWPKTVISLVRRFVEFYCNDNLECFPKTSLFQACPWNGKIMSSLLESFANRQTKFLYWIMIHVNQCLGFHFYHFQFCFIINIEYIIVRPHF